MCEPSRHEIWKMFDRISPTYDRINRLMSFGRDKYWRKKMAFFLPKKESIFLLDAATGTGDQILALAPTLKQAVGIDLSVEMLRLAQKKIEKHHLSSKVSFQEASLLCLPFNDKMFDCVTISFGIRNVTDVEIALKECYRVLQRNGRLLILESTVPSYPWMLPFYFFYLRYILPLLGAFFSKNKTAYRYLNQTIETFPAGENFCKLLQLAGFQNTQIHPLSAGVVTIYTADKYEF